MLILAYHPTQMHKLLPSDILSSLYLYPTALTNIFMHFSIQTTLIHQVRTNITIIRSRVNQNVNKLIKKLTSCLDNSCLVLFLLIIQSCIDMRNDLPNIPNSMRLLLTIDIKPTTLIQQTISLEMFLSTCLTLQPSCTITSIMLL